jgi:glutathione synthase/RimK-type ligase-like ATP-grasp enzyme
MKNILIITSSFDLTSDYLISKFGNKANFYRFNTDYFGEYLIDIHSLKGWNISSKYWSLNEQDVFSIYYRKPTLPKLDNYESKYHGLMYKDMITTIDGIMEVFNRRCLSKPSILRKSENKIFQMRIAEVVGFDMPESLITNSKDSASKFCSNKNRIVKPLSMGKLSFENRVGIIQTNLVSQEVALDNLECSTTYFQQYIPKDYEVRVTIINKNCHAVRIDSKEKVDWRKSDNKNTYSVISLPEEIREKCFTMLKELKLDFGAFDFIVNDGKFIFLEVNPNGQWYWLEEELNLDISDDIVAFLTEGDN